MNQTIAEIGPQEAWDRLASDSSIRLVDVRTRAEWSFVGVPDLSALGGQTVLVEWKSFPTMARNDNFVADLLAALGEASPSQLLFICRSGARSMEAARAVCAAMADNAGAPQCINVAEGFEGDLNSAAHRGLANGWKAAGLAWRQS